MNPNILRHYDILKYLYVASIDLFIVTAYFIHVWETINKILKFRFRKKDFFTAVSYINAYLAFGWSFFESDGDQGDWPPLWAGHVPIFL